MRVLKITYKKSVIGYNQRQKDTVKALGLKRLNSSVLQPDNPQIRGMVKRVCHLVEVASVVEAQEAQK
jgi:large subunit ribosomal protein L30